jgi:hypothetical protein
MSPQQWIATRTLTDAIGDQIVVKIGVPEMVEPAHWRCPVMFVVDGKQEIKHAYGMDAWQAVILAPQLVRKELIDRGATHWWDGGEPGDPGFPMIVPPSFGIAFSRKLEAMIEKELEVYSQAIEKRVDSLKTDAE